MHWLDVDATVAREWDNYLAGYDGPGGCLEYGWLSIIQESMRLKAHALAAIEGARFAGVLPLIEQRDPWGRRFLTSLPFVNYSGIAASTEDGRNVLLQGVRTLLKDKQASYACLRCPPGVHLPMKTVSPKTRAILPLPDSVDEAWSGLRSKVRSQIRRPLKSGLKASASSPGELKEFYRLLSIKWREHGTPVLPERFFRLLRDVFPDRSEIVTVVDVAVTAGAAWLFCHRDRVEVMWAATRREYDRLGVSMLLYWTAIERAIQQAMPALDFGRSERGSGNERFKAQWGGLTEPLPWYILDGSGHFDWGSRSGQGATGRLARRIWRRLPLGATRVVGPSLARRLPL